MARRADLHKRIREAMENVRAEIRGNVASGGRFAGALSMEGYAGGYYDALADIELLLNGVTPNRRTYWSGDGKR